jgi:hypothetical protein
MTFGIVIAKHSYCTVHNIGKGKDYKGGYRLTRKIEVEGFEADLYMKH